MTRIADLLAAGRTISFEFFPPKTDEAERQLEKALHELAPLAPSFVSVTYGAGGSTRDRTRELVIRINRDFAFPAMAHLTCIGHTRAELVGLLERYRDEGVENILALGGDPPADGSPATGDYRHAIDLVRLVREVHPAASVGVAAHPELHPRSADRDSDRRHLAAKLAEADFGVTQFFFTVDHHLRMLDELDALGCRTPVLPGVLPIVNVAGTKRMASMNGTEIPAGLLARIEAAEDRPEDLQAIGVEVATDLARRLLDAGAPGLHLYAMNRSASVRAVLANLGLA